MKKILDLVYRLKHENEIEITKCIEQDTFEDSKEGREREWFVRGKQKALEKQRDNLDFIILKILEEK